VGGKIFLRQPPKKGGFFMANMSEQLKFRPDEFMAPEASAPLGNSLVSKVDFHRVVYPPQSINEAVA